MCDKIENENNDVENFNLYDNDEESDNKINEGNENQEIDENIEKEKESAQREYLYKQ